MLTTRDIANRYSLKMIGDDREIINLGKLDYSLEGLLSYAETEEYYVLGLSNPYIRAMITREQYGPLDAEKTYLYAENPKHTFYQLHNYLADETEYYKGTSKSVISTKARIDSTACISGKNVFIGDYAVIGPHVTIMGNVHIDEGAIIQAGTAVGLDGHEHFHINNSVLSIKHAGGVVIGRNVNIGANCTIDKGIFRENTVIGDEAKIDHMVHVGHGANIGERTFIAANSGIGRCRIGRDVFIGFASTILPGVNVDNHARISIGAVVTRNVKEGEQVTGNFAIDHDKYIQFLKSIS